MEQGQQHRNSQVAFVAETVTGGTIGIIVMLIVTYALLQYTGNLPSCPSSKKQGGTETPSSVLTGSNPLRFGQRFTHAPSASNPADQQFSFYSPPPYPKDTLPPQPGTYPSWKMPAPVAKNKVVLMSTLEEFPWKQIPGNVTNMEIHVEATIGPQHEETFTVVESGNKEKDVGLRVYCFRGIVYFCFLGCCMGLTVLPYKPPPTPIGVLTLGAKIVFTGDSMVINAQAQVGDKQLFKNTNTKQAEAYGKDVRALFPSLDPKMYQGPNITALQTNVQWHSR